LENQAAAVPVVAPSITATVTKQRAEDIVFRMALLSPKLNVRGSPYALGMGIQHEKSVARSYSSAAVYFSPL
jgi:hypothetical protein